MTNKLSDKPFYLWNIKKEFGFKAFCYSITFLFFFAYKAIYHHLKMSIFPKLVEVIFLPYAKTYPFLFFLSFITLYKTILLLRIFDTIKTYLDSFLDITSKNMNSAINRMIQKLASIIILFLSLHITLELIHRLLIIVFFLSKTLQKTTYEKAVIGGGMIKRITL